MHSAQSRTQLLGKLAMAPLYNRVTKKQMFLFFSFFCFLQFFSVSSFEYQVGGHGGWVVPPANDTRIYNDWASENRFQVGDTVRFTYRKDSVMEVSKAEYKKCNSTHPNYFSNTGNTVFKLDHSGAFYFISGVSGHCEKGQKMIIKVMLPEEEYSSHNGHKKSAGSRAAVVSLGVLKLVFAQVLLSYVASCFFN